MADDIRSDLRERDVAGPIEWHRYLDSRVHVDASLLGRLNDVFYRYATLPEAADLLHRRNITLVDPCCWRDKYERHVVDSLFGQKSLFFGMKVFAKCFSSASSSEALWRLFAEEGPVVRYGVHLSDLLNAFKNARQKNVGKIFVAEVRYEKPQSLKRRLSGVEKGDMKRTGRKAAEFLFYKRDAFDHEKELRVVATTKHQAAGQSLALSEFRPEKITRVLIDPYVQKWQADLYVGMLKDGLLYRGRVEQSKFDEDVVSATRK